MKIGVSIVQFVVKVPNLVQIIAVIYREQCYKVPIVNPRWPRKIQDGYKWEQVFVAYYESMHFFKICSGRRWFPTHHLDRFDVSFETFQTRVTNFLWKMCKGGDFLRTIDISKCMVISPVGQILHCIDVWITRCENTLI